MKALISGFWSNRPESIFSVSKKVYLFLKQLSEQSTYFEELKIPGDSKKQALSNSFLLSEESVFKKLIESREKEEINEEGFCEIGFSISLFNVLNDSISVNVNICAGVSSEYVKNSCVIKISGGFFSEDQIISIKGLLSEFFTPEDIRIR